VVVELLEVAAGEEWWLATAAELLAEVVGSLEGVVEEAWE